MKRTKKQATKQGSFEFKPWGGARKGAGRPPKGERSGVSHLRREALASRFPVHVTCRLSDELPSLRGKAVYRVLKGAFLGGRERFGFRLVQYSVQSNHLHLLVEAKDRQALTRGMQGLSIRLAKALNRFWGRRGSVFSDRFHDRILRTPREVRNVLAYVLNNCRKHGIALPGPDHYSSAGWFDGWRDVEVVGAGPPVVAEARTWLLRTGWRRHGLICWKERPSNRSRP